MQNKEQGIQCRSDPIECLCAWAKLWAGVSFPEVQFTAWLSIRFVLRFISSAPIELEPFYLFTSSERSLDTRGFFAAIFRARFQYLRSRNDCYAALETIKTNRIIDRKWRSPGSKLPQGGQRSHGRFDRISYFRTWKHKKRGGTTFRTSPIAKFHKIIDRACAHTRSNLRKRIDFIPLGRCWLKRGSWGLSVHKNKVGIVWKPSALVSSDIQPGSKIRKGGSVKQDR